MNRLKELREDNDLLQREVADALGISQRNYSYFETGQTLLTEDILRKIANYYKTSVDYVLYKTDVRKPYPASIVKEELEEKAKEKTKRKRRKKEEVKA